MYYFDNSATTQPLKSIVDVYAKVSIEYFANPSSAHRIGEMSRKLLTQARQQVADILGFNKEEVYFTGSGTESNNWLFKGVLPAIKDKSDDKNRILISSIEHPSIKEQIPYLEERGFQVDMIPVNEAGQINVTSFERLVDKDVLMVVTMAVNNEVGAIQPIKKLSEVLRRFPQIIWHVDGVQTVTSQLSLLDDNRIDCISLSSHKFHSIRGVGIFTKRQRVNSYPMLHGGGQEQGLRASTEHLAGIVATAKALRLAKNQQMKAKESLVGFRKYIIQSLKENNWQIFSENQASEHIICAALPPIPGEVLLHAFEAENVYISTTSACSSRKHAEHATLSAMGIIPAISKSAIRFSMSQYTEIQEVEYVCQVIDKVSKQFK